MLSPKPANTEFFAAIGTGRCLFGRYDGRTTETSKMVLNNSFRCCCWFHFLGSKLGRSLHRQSGRNQRTALRRGSHSKLSLLFTFALPLAHLQLGPIWTGFFTLLCVVGLRNSHCAT